MASRYFGGLFVCNIQFLTDNIGEPESKVAPVASTPVISNKAKEVVKGPAKIEFSNAGSKWLVENQTADKGK